MTTMSERLLETTSKLGAQIDTLTVTLSKLDEIINGTAKTGGVKERIAIAEQEIQRNKESFLTINKNITELRTEMLIEMGKISNLANTSEKEKRDFWRDLGQGALKVAVATITAGVVGIVFWQFIVWLAANAPVP